MAANGRTLALLPYARLTVAQIAIGAAAIFARYALAGAGPLAVSALRLIIATVVILAIARGVVRISQRREIAFGFAGLALALHFAAWLASLAYTSVAIATLLVTTTPLWTELYDVVRERRAPSRTFVVALVLGFAGVALVTMQSSAGRPPLPGHERLGEALALIGSFAIGAYLLIVRAAAVDAAGARLQTRQIVARTYAWAALALVAAAAFAHQPPPAIGNVAAWGGIVAMALGSQLLGHTALNAALADFTPSVVALSTLCEPIVAAALAALAFHENLGPPTITGGALVLLAVAITLRNETPTRNPSSLAEL